MSRDSGRRHGSAGTTAHWASTKRWSCRCLSDWSRGYASGGRRPLPDDVGDVDGFWNQPDAGEAVGDRLLALDDLIVERSDAIDRAIDEAADRLDVDAG